MKSFAARILRQCSTWLLCNMRRNWLRRLWWGRDRNLLPLSSCIITAFFQENGSGVRKACFVEWVYFQNGSPDGLERCNKELLKYKKIILIKKQNKQTNKRPKDHVMYNLIADVLKHVANRGKFGRLLNLKTSELPSNYIKSPFPINIRRLKMVYIMLYFFHILFIRMVSVSTK